MRPARSVSRLQVAFDDQHAVAGAGLLLNGTLDQRLASRLADQLFDLGQRPGIELVIRDLPTFVRFFGGSRG